jgi:hypothetical protein
LALVAQTPASFCGGASEVSNFKFQISSLQMSASEKIFIHGLGAVSPAGWGLPAFREALERGEPLPSKDLARPGWTHPHQMRQVPPPNPKPAFMAHARLRRTSPIAHYAVAAALEALGEDAAKFSNGTRLGIILCTEAGCVNYSRRFYDEVLKEPATASPLVFPETVFNAPASHLAALLGTTAINYTLVGDPGIFLNGLALAADWLLSDRVDGCIVIGAEERDWLIAGALRLFSKTAILSDGAGAVYLKRESDRNPAVQLQAITSPQLFTVNQSRAQAAQRVRAEISVDAKNTLLCDGLLGVAPVDRYEQSAWADWTGERISPKKILGEGIVAAAAWQCVAAADALARGKSTSAIVNIIGCNEQAIAAHFSKV